MPNYALGPANPPCGLAVAPVATKPKMAKVQLSPNPTTGRLRVQYDAGQGRDQRLVITDLYGRQLMEVKLRGGQQDIELGERPAGIYYYQYFIDGRNIDNGKIELLR